MNVFDDIFDLMTYVMDIKALNGFCSYSNTVEKFGIELLVKAIVELKLLSYNKENGSLIVTENGWKYMKPF